MTNAELAILTLVAEKPCHGYQIEQTIEQRGMREWTEIGFSSIYYLLKKLESQDLITGQLEETGSGPARKVYHITSQGQNALQSELLGALSMPQRCYTSFSLAVGNLPVIEHDQAITSLKEYSTSLAARLEQVRERWEEQQPLPYFVDALFDYSVSMIQAELDWVNKFIRQLEAINEQDRLQTGI
jgi:DNA-binding PadR family transcriptional regulator